MTPRAPNYKQALIGEPWKLLDILISQDVTESSPNCQAATGCVVLNPAPLVLEEFQPGQLAWSGAIGKNEYVAVATHRPRAPRWVFGFRLAGSIS